MTIKALSVRAGCATGNVADGGYVIKIEARNAATGLVLGAADLMHGQGPQVSAGAVVGPWTTLGCTSRFRYSSCYRRAARRLLAVPACGIRPDPIDWVVCRRAGLSA